MMASNTQSMCGHCICLNASFQKFPHIIFTAKTDWDPSVLDGGFNLIEIFDASMYYYSSKFDSFENNRKGTVMESTKIHMEDPMLQSTALP